jgi:hypothetical protein
MNFFLVLIALFVIGDLLWWRAAHRRLRARGWRWAAALFVLGQMIGLGLVLSARFFGEAWADSLPRPVVSAVFLWHLCVVLPWLILRSSCDIATGAAALARRLAGLKKRAPIENPSQGMSRREFLSASATFAPAVLTLGAAGWSEPQLEEFRVRKLEVPLADLPPALDGLTIAHVSDVHVGRFTRGKVLERIVEETNRLDAGVVAITGDLINLSLRDLPAAADLVRGFRAKHGVFMCEGNHDLIESAGRFRGEAERAHLPLLRSEAATIEAGGQKVQILGLPWAFGDRGHREEMERLAPLRQADAFPIVLAHHPHAFDFAEGWPLLLAGHTHGGQLMINEKLGFGPCFFRYWSGLYRQKNRALVVSNGVGNWFPLRIAAPAEIIHVTLRRG